MAPISSQKSFKLWLEAVEKNANFRFKGKSTAKQAERSETVC